MVALVAVPALLFQPEGLPRLRVLRAELTRVDADNEQLSHDIDRLRAQVVDLRDNPKAVERIARQQLGLVRKNEVVFYFGKNK